MSEATNGFVLVAAPADAAIRSRQHPDHDTGAWPPETAA